MYLSLKYVIEFCLFQVNIPPSLTLTPKGSIRVKEGDTVRLQCEARGEPVPKVFWERVNGYM